MKNIHTKVVATLGPASNNKETIEQLVAAGADVFRLNMSHGDHETHAESVRMIRAASLAAGRPIGILCDISGPKIRIGVFPEGPIDLVPDKTFTFSIESLDGTIDGVSVNYKHLTKDVKVGEHILLDDGILELVVESINDPYVQCRVLRGGPLSSRKGLNLPNSKLSISSITDKDRADIEFGLNNDVDMFAISFVRTAEDIIEAREYMNKLGGDLPLIAKIEMSEAVDNIEAILRVADAAMVARGDLGVEIPLEKVPHVQKRVISICNRLAKPVITATQMLDSMIRSARPTRAEVNDVANAILDGSDAVMLSGETAAGLHPVESVKIMKRIAQETEAHINYEGFLTKRFISEERRIPDAISYAAAQVAQDLNVHAILCLTQGGGTVRRVARYRPKGGVLAYCTSRRTVQQLTLSWGVIPLAREGAVDIEVERRQGAEVQIRKAIDLFQYRGILHSGQDIVVAAGLPLHQPGSTNLIRVTQVS